MDNNAATEYARIYNQLSDNERIALDLRQRALDTLKPSDYREGDDLCPECGAHGSVTTYGPCTECFIDSAVNDDDDFESIVRSYYVEELPTTETIWNGLTEKYVEFSRNLDRKITARWQDAMKPLVTVTKEKDGRVVARFEIKIGGTDEREIRATAVREAVKSIPFAGEHLRVFINGKESFANVGGR